MTARTLLTACLQYSSEGQALIHYLAPLEKKAVETLPPTTGNPLEHPGSIEETLSGIHSSWISPFLRTLSEKEIGFFLDSLSQPQASSVGKELLFTGKLPSVSTLGKTYLKKTLLGYLTAEIDDLLPLAALPESPLNVLLEIKDETLSLSLDFLGLHDLAVEVKQIIDKQKLSKIYDTLTPPQLTYLKILLQSPEPVSFTKMGLSSWDENPDKLKTLLRQRGANRLAKAISGHDPSFIWYLLHKFDVEKALLIKKLSTPLDNPRATQILIGQVLEFITYTRQHHE